MNTDISTLLKYANLQMAAEALYGLKGQAPGATFAGDISPAFLTEGNERASRFPSALAASFLAEDGR